MATYDPVAHDGIEVVESTRPLRQYDDGMQHMPHSDKQLAPGVIEYYNKIEPEEELSHPNMNFSEKRAGGTQQPPSPPVNDTAKDSRICGLTRPVFFAIYAILAVIILAAAIGGGIAGTRHRESRHVSHPDTSSSSSPSTTQSSSSTSSSATSSTFPSTSTTPSSSTPTSTSSSIPTYGAYNCPADNSTLYTTTSTSPSFTFRLLCNIDYPSGILGINSGVVVDLNSGIITTSIRACADQCAANRANGGGCSAVTYGANITLALSRVGITGNCFLKNQRGRNGVGDGSGQVESAFLVGD